MTDTPKKPRGLAAMSVERRREIAAMGGRASKPVTWTDPEVARAASLKGVEARRVKREAAKNNA